MLRRIVNDFWRADYLTIFCELDFTIDLLLLSRWKQMLHLGCFRFLKIYERKFLTLNMNDCNLRTQLWRITERKTKQTSTKKRKRHPTDYFSGLYSKSKPFMNFLSPRVFYDSVYQLSLDSEPKQSLCEPLFILLLTFPHSGLFQTLLTEIAFHWRFYQFKWYISWSCSLIIF